MDVVERFHEIMKLKILKAKKKLKVLLLGQYKEYPTNDYLYLFYSSKNYRPIPIHRPNDLNLSEKQWNQFDGDERKDTNLSKRSYIPGLLNISNGVAEFININPQIYQSILQVVIGLIVFATEHFLKSETESKDKQQLTNELERIIADGTDDNGDENQSEGTIELKHFNNENDRLRKNDSGTQLKATVTGNANPEINITKISANTSLHNVNGLNGLG
ncbi:MAG: hypothetical protein EZS28_030467 [Streblomastix strix]|uniref:Uncharacterized protein n=1 Tax=Streblomastix strix TaxID=222440 RepID=A0A5J4UUQ2_9EUKA|nr:MAG: hypothetical protein EZS28_030467 [Streblomastix strix]